MKKNRLKLIVFDNCKELGEKVSNHLKAIYDTDENYLVNQSSSRFANGEGKVKINETVRASDLYILSDVGNHNVSYQMHGNSHFMGPDEHFQDIKRAISATSGHADKLTVVMPLLYESRQHNRKGRESLDCALSLQELERLGVRNIVTFDAHDPNVCNAIPTLPFDNFYPTHAILDRLIEEEKENFNNFFVVSPDIGAMERARYYADMIGSDVGVFYKRRDYSKVVNGKNPIVAHTYLGDDVGGKNVIVVDDMIASGNSMLEVCEELKSRGAKNVYLIATFALFTEGTKVFEKAYENKMFTKLFSTNLTYVPEDIKKQSWYREVDCSKQIAVIISTLHNNDSIAHLFNGKAEILKKIQKYQKRFDN